MKRYLLLLILLFTGVITATAQVEERFKTRQKDTTKDTTEERQPATANDPPPPVVQKENFWDRVVIGGNASLSFGTYTFIYLAPTVGYKFTDNLVAGPGFIYQYAHFSEIRQNGQTLQESYEFSVYGPKAFVNYIVADRFYGGVQFEYLNHDMAWINTATTLPSLVFENVWTPVLFLEAGLLTSLGQKGFVQLGLRYNLLHGPDSPYPNAFFPVIGVFF